MIRSPVFNVKMLTRWLRPQEEFGEHGGKMLLGGTASGSPCSVSTHRSDFISQRGKGGVGLENSLPDQMSLRFPVLPRFHLVRNTFSTTDFLVLF